MESERVNLETTLSNSKTIFSHSKLMEPIVHQSGDNISGISIAASNSMCMRTFACLWLPVSLLHDVRATSQADPSLRHVVINLK